jgi:hypothetical protein
LIGEQGIPAERLEAARADTVVYSIFLRITIKKKVTASADPVADRRVAGGPAEVGPVAEAPEGEAAEVVVSDPLKRPGLMGRKFSSESPKKQAAVSLKFPRRKRWIKSTQALQRNCARSTAWATHPTKPTMPLATTRSA